MDARSKSVLKFAGKHDAGFKAAKKKAEAKKSGAKSKAIKKMC